MPKVARVASVVAFLLAGLLVISALRRQISLLPFALIPLAAGIGILRRRVWSSYGFALFELSELLLVPLLFLRSSDGTAGWEKLVPLLMLSAVLIALFFSAGRSLARVGGRGGGAWRWVALSALCTIPFLFLEAFVIPTGAMEDTLLIGDYILVQRFPKSTPVRGDIVTFIYPVDRSQTFVKRVIGVPGDRIRMVAKTVYRNGGALSEPYAVHKFSLIEDYRDNFPAGFAQSSLPPAAQDMLSRHVVKGEVVVPAGKYFVLGDNRDNSLDSRYWGFLDAADIIGKPRLIYDSEEPAGTDLASGRPFRMQRVRWDRLFKVL